MEMAVADVFSDAWVHFTTDDGGHTFRLSWHPVAAPARDSWHPVFVSGHACVRVQLAALEALRSSVEDRLHQ